MVITGVGTTTNFGSRLVGCTSSDDWSTSRIFKRNYKFMSKN